MDEQADYQGRKIEVKCYSGFKGNETPRALKVTDNWSEISDIRKLGIEEEVNTGIRRTFFRVLTDEGREFVIAFNETSGDWILKQELN